MATISIFGRTFEHLNIVRSIGNPVSMYVVQTDEGYYIHTANMAENLYKTVTSIYADDDLDAVIIIPASELPEDAELLGAGGNTEVASADEETSPETT